MYYYILLFLILAVVVASVVMLRRRQARTQEIQGPQGIQGIQGEVGGSVSPTAYGYARGGTDLEIDGDADVEFDSNSYPSYGITVPSMNGDSTMTILTTGDYEFDFFVTGRRSANVVAGSPNAPMQLALYVNANPGGDGVEFSSHLSSSSGVADVLICKGHGIIHLIAGDLVTLRNRTNSTVGNDGQINVTADSGGGNAGANRVNRSLTLNLLQATA